MPTEPRPPYPRTPAYGEGVTRRPAPAPAAASPSTVVGPPVEPRSAVPAVALAVAVNAVTLLGVLAGWWPAGNVFLLFWVENVVLGLITLVRITTSASRPGERVATALFFCVHYGIFCVVHLVFTWLVASTIGVEVSWLVLGLPVVLLVVRYGAELATTWFGGRGLRARTTARTAASQPYPRIVVLHLAVLVSFFLGLASLADVGGTFGSAMARLGALGLRDGVLAVAVLVVVKTLVDVATTRRVLRAR